MPDLAAAEPAMPITRGRGLHLRAFRRSIVPDPEVLARTNVAGRAVAWLFPWTVDTYPGRHRGVLSLLGNRVTWAYVRHWMTGRRPIPPWARAVLADYLRSRAAVALELAAELEQEQPRKRGNRQRSNEAG
jgi:hypothetical protein